METPVYKLFLVKPTLEAVTLPQERIEGYFQKHDQTMKDLGVRSLISGTLWSDERYTGFGVEWFPSWKAVREFGRVLDELHWLQYIQSEIYLGVDDQENANSLTPLELDPNVDWITQIWLARDMPAMHDISESEMAAGMKVIEEQRALGARPLLNAFSLPINEEWKGWGIELYPSMEVLVQKTRLQEKVKWWKFIQARTFLGTADAGELIQK